MSNIIINPHRHAKRFTFSGNYTSVANDGYTVEAEVRLTYEGVAVQIGDFGLDRVNNAFWWFPNVDVPQGASIVSATFNNCIRGSYAGSGQPTQWTWVGAKQANPSAPTDYADYWSRPLTAATLDVTRQGPYTDDSWEQTENLAPIFQEIIDQALWATGNSILIFGRYTGGGFGRSWDSASASLPRTLTIEYLT